MTVSIALLVLAIGLLLWPGGGRRFDVVASTIGGRRVWERFTTLSIPDRSGRWIIGTAAVVGTLVALFAPWHAALSAGVLSAVAASSWSQGQVRRRDAARLAQDVETLQAIAAELRAGNDLAAALRSAGTIADTTMCSALTRAAHAIQMGHDPAASLDRAGVDGVDQLAGLVRLSGARGIALAEAVEVLAGDATERANARRDVASLLAGPRATAAMLTLLPLFGILMGQTIGADPWRVLLHTSAGAIAMLAGTALAAAGVLWTGAMVGGAER
jgi:tight adherence protein B